MTINALIEALDGYGLVVTDPSEVWYRLVDLGVDPDDEVESNCECEE